MSIDEILFEFEIDLGSIFKCWMNSIPIDLDFSGGGQNLERWNVERSIFRNIKITIDELFDSFIMEFIFFIFYSFEEPKYLIIL